VASEIIFVLILKFATQPRAHVFRIRHAKTPGVSAVVEEDGPTADGVESVTIARWKTVKLNVLKVDYLTEICNVYVRTHKRNHRIVTTIVGLSVENVEPVTRMETVSAQEITRLVSEDVRFVKENQSATRFVEYPVSVSNTRFVAHQVAFVLLSLRNAPKSVQNTADVSFPARAASSALVSMMEALRKDENAYLYQIHALEVGRKLHAAFIPTLFVV